MLSQVDEKFVRTGKLELVFLNLPLEMHANAFKAAQAAACAGDQKKFWDMYHLLFENQRALGPDQLPGYGERIGLDAAAFQKCLASGQHEAAIRDDARLAQSLGLYGTPAYLLGRRLPGGDKVEIVDVIKGVPPYEELEKRINALLASK